MRDKVLTYAIAASIAAHLIVVGIVGRTSAARLNAAPEPVTVEQLIKVDLVKEPAEATKEKPKPPTTSPKSEPADILRPQPAKLPKVHAAKTVPTIPKPAPKLAAVTPRPRVRPAVVAPSKPVGKGHQTPGDPGGKLNIGSQSDNGDLQGKWSGGSTPTGWVPGSDSGKGKGSGDGVGAGRPDPVKNASPGPGTTPAPAPKSVRVRVCDASGMLPGEYCRSTSTKSFIEGSQPSRVCNQCKAPHVSRIADQAKPILIKDASVSVPYSVAEGQSLKVKVEYVVTETGSVTDVKVISSSGNRAVDKAVISTTSKLKYKPAVQDGTPRSVKMTRTYRINT